MLALLRGEDRENGVPQTIHLPSSLGSHLFVGYVGYYFDKLCFN
jgi:hypothetical protein